MANLGKIIYGRKFQEEEREENISTHGSPKMQTYWGENYEDEKIKKTMIKNFSLDTLNEWSNHIGSDGTFNYTFSQYGCPKITKNKENGPEIYEKQYLIKKTGNEKDRGKLADIETFLLTERFIPNLIPSK
ncbi:MAG: hypothetical protein KKG94_02095 [Nanoarchaeota archaeon]|nr:hypothetical protein [Nanoarchaeota archaeon]